MNRNDHQDSQLQAELAKLKAEHQRLRDDKLRTERDVAHLTQQLEDVQERARQEYGTSDPAELQALLDQRRQENTEMVAAYREHLQALHAGLSEVEQRVDAAQDGNE